MENKRELHNWELNLSNTKIVAEQLLALPASFGETLVLHMKKRGITSEAMAEALGIYSYDRGGNILSKARYAYTIGELGTAAQVVPYAYGDANWKDKLTAYNGKSITYDAIGNPLTDGTWTYQWQAGRQLKQMTKSGTTIQFKYDHNGLRVSKVVNGTETKYMLHGKLVTHLTVGGDNLHFFYDAQSRPAKVSYNGVIYTYIHNLQGDIVGLLDNAGALVVEYRYDAWGKVISTTGSLDATLGKRNPFRYRGYVYDEETGLYYLRSRYYDAECGRFISIDMMLASVGSICGHNAFVYSINNPLVLKDDEGTWPSWITAVVSVAVAVVTAVAIVAAAPAAACVATASLVYMGVGATAASTIATVGTSIAVSVGLLAAVDNVAVAVAGTSPVKELVFNGDQDSYEMFQMAGMMSTAGLTYASDLATMTGTCFVSGTLVETAHGLKPIEQIAIDDMVWAEDSETGEKALKRVVQTFVKETETLLHLIVGDEEIVTTPEHPFYVAGNGWIRAEELRCGDLLVSRNDKRVPVDNVRIERIEESQLVYNFEVDGFHTYFVGLNRLLVHNKCKTEVHHVVERSQIKKSGFTKSAIEAPSNKVVLDYYVHRKISGYYSSVTETSHPLRVRNWLAGRSFEYQTEFGWDIIKKYRGY